ncbi:hypothetical protein B0293_39420 [Amycolatopsis azurea DSM 43854]|uniref:Secreted protein n=1 Tax=Amycolatopsis azurea DSM 43854 TaxID=1238180 RepID=A0ABX3J088_9PSEU|nr:hypothetical protein B0293_39420 [Amycolatopsis azurea DSM 43854]
MFWVVLLGGKAKAACSFARRHADLGCRESHVRNVEGCERGFRNASGTPPHHENRQTRGEVRESLLEGPRVPQGGLHGPEYRPTAAGTIPA